MGPSSTMECSECSYKVIHNGHSADSSPGPQGFWTGRLAPVTSSGASDGTQLAANGWFGVPWEGMLGGYQRFDIFGYDKK